MKHVNLDPDLEKKKEEIMEQFLEDDNGGLALPEPDAEAIARLGDGSGQASPETLQERVVEALKTVYDPEIPVNIYDLGLIYRVDISAEGFAEVDMTLTAPGCPVAQTFPGMIERTVKLVPGITDAVVELVWDPPWTPELISEAARLELGLV